MTIIDPIREGMEKQGWSVTDAFTLDKDRTVDTDVVIIGTGAGGGTAAEILSRRGLQVTLIEAGPLKSSRDFSPNEGVAYAQLYKEGISQTNTAKNLLILQGRCVGGSTTVNWTSSFRTPTQTLHYWRERFGIKGLDQETLAPWFEKMEQRLGVAKWQHPNANNEVLKRGCEQLDWQWDYIPRNVSGCWNLGYCGLGCPTNAKQSMLVTTIPAVLQNGGQLFHRARAQQLLVTNNRVTGVICQPVDSDGTTRPYKLTVQAKHTIVAAGGIGSPGLLMRSNAPDPAKQLGKRTFIHPTTFSMAKFEHKIAGFHGAPQSVYSDHFQWLNGTDTPGSFIIEAAPIQPVLALVSFGGHGQRQFKQMQHLPHRQSLIAIHRDGFHEHSAGGSISLRSDGSAALHYEMSDAQLQALRHSYTSMAEIQFAAGAKWALPAHFDAKPQRSLKAAKEMINSLAMHASKLRIGSAHVMGGCSMSADSDQGVVDSRGRHWHWQQLSVMDGSIFPTSIGANPQLSIYAMVAKMASSLADELQRSESSSK